MAPPEGRQLRYVPRGGKVIKVPISVSIAAEELERIRKGRGDFYQPQDIVNESRPAHALLHPAFEWNDDVAAKRYRVDQARYIPCRRS
jgi:hypothetical protein